MPRRRGPRPPALADRDLAEEVLYLHSLWRRGPPAPAPAPVPATAPIPSPTTRRKASKRKRRRVERGAAAEPTDDGSEWPLAPSPRACPKAWPDAAATSSPAKPPPQPRSPGSVAQREALHAAEEFFSNRGSDEDEDEGSESEGDEEAAGFFTGMFERDAALRGHYELDSEEGVMTLMSRKCRRRLLRPSTAWK